MASQGLLEINVLKFILLVLIIVLNTRYSKCDGKELFHRTDIRLSVFREPQMTNICSSKEECCMRCLSNKNCHSVRLFPLEGGFLAEHLPIAAAADDDKLRVYEDLNGKLKQPS